MCAIKSRFAATNILTTADAHDLIVWEAALDAPPGKEFMLCLCCEPHQTALEMAEYCEARATDYPHERKILVALTCRICGRSRRHSVYFGSTEWPWAFALARPNQEVTLVTGKEVAMGA
jgi:hypothetical protein